MTPQTLTERLQMHEEQLVDQFRQHPIVSHLDALDDRTIETLLMQRRLLTLHFTPVNL